MVKYWGKEYNNFCSNSYKVYSVYESPEITLLDEVVRATETAVIWPTVVVER